MKARLLDAGDAAVTVEFGDRIAGELVARVGALERALDAARARGELPGVVETVPTFRSLTLLYDPLQTSRARLDPALLALLQQSEPVQAAPPRRWRLPVCYGDGFGADLAEVAAATGLTPEAVVQLHSGTEVQRLHARLHARLCLSWAICRRRWRVPRRREPRLRVPAGSVAITGSLSAIYPWESPGGWH